MVQSSYCQRLEVWGQNPLPPEASRSWSGAPSARKFLIVKKKQLNFRTILVEIRALKCGIKISMIKLAA